MGRLKIELGKMKQGRKLVTFLKTDQHTTREEILRCVNWQAGLLGVSGGVQLERHEARQERTVMYMRGATAYITNADA